MSKLSRKEITNEEVRQYTWFDPITKRKTGIKIFNPIYVWFQSNGATHRVQDHTGNVYIVPSPGNFGCLITYFPRDIENPVVF